MYQMVRNYSLNHERQKKRHAAEAIEADHPSVGFDSVNDDEIDAAGWEISDTQQHVETMFMLGTDVDGSCQSVHGSADLNRCLISYMLDPSVRAVVVRDAEGIIVARRILRMMLHTNPSGEEQPVLVLFDCYNRRQSTEQRHYEPDLQAATFFHQ